MIFGSTTQWASLASEPPYAHVYVMAYASIASSLENEILRTLSKSIGAPTSLPFHKLVCYKIGSQHGAQK